MSSLLKVVKSHLFPQFALGIEARLRLSIAGGRGWHGTRELYIGGAVAVNRGGQASIGNAH